MVSRSFGSSRPLPLVLSHSNYDGRNRKINTSPSTIDDKEALKKMLTTPPVKKINLHFPLGIDAIARNSRGVTIRDALDAIHKPYKKRVRGAFP